MHAVLKTTISAVMALAAAAVTPAGGAEGDAPRDQEAMRPTKLGLRMTPRVARGLARNWVCELAGMQMFGGGNEKKIDLTDEQRSRMADAAARRLMRMAHKNGKTGQWFFESLFELMLLSGDDKIKREYASEFAERGRPVVPLARDFLKGFSEDCRPMLDAKQSGELQGKLDTFGRQIDRFDEKMKQWADGDVEKGGANPFGDLDDPDDDETGEPESKEAKQRKQHLRNAERITDWNIRQLGPWEWSRFLFGAGHFFGFDDEQSAEGEKILADYRQQAEAIMTDEWNTRVRRNRIQYNFRWQLQELADGPWTYHLERQFKKMAAPLKELGQSFREKILALVTDEQREAALAKVRESIEKHGMTLDETDARILGLAREPGR